MAKSEHELKAAFSSRRIVVTRPGAAGESFAKLLTELGADVLFEPAISFAEPDDIEPFREAIRNIDSYDWLLCTSANAVNAIAEQIQMVHGRLDIQLPAIAAVGPTTATAIRSLGWTVAFTPTRSSGSALGDELPAGSRARVLLPRTDIASADLPNSLRERNCLVHDVVAYRTLSNESNASTISHSAVTVDALTFTSPSTVRTYVGRANAAGWDIANEQRTSGLLIACVGETTAEAVREHNLQADVVATEQTMQGLIDALAAEFRRRDQFDAPSSKHSGSY